MKKWPKNKLKNGIGNAKHSGTIIPNIILEKPVPENLSNIFVATKRYVT